MFGSTSRLFARLILFTRFRPLRFLGLGTLVASCGLACCTTSSGGVPPLEDSAEASASGGSSASATAAGGASGAPGGPQMPFAGHRFRYPAGAILPKGGQAALDAATAAFYEKWRTKYLRADCGGYFVFSGGGTGADANTVSISEGHGYGMLTTVLMAGYDAGARRYFDGLYSVFRAFPSVNSKELMSWDILKGCKLPSGADNLADSAVDGDLDIAFSLLLADKQWGSAGAVNYLAEAKKVIAAIKTHEINPDTHLIMMGDWSDIRADYYAKNYAMAMGPYGKRGAHKAYYYGTRPADFMLGHFKAYGAATSDAGWTAVVDAHYAAVAALQTKFSPASGLLPDFADATGGNIAPVKANYLEESTDGDYGFNSCRVPWRLGIDFLGTGEPRAKAALDRINVWIKKSSASNPAQVTEGYHLDGSRSTPAAMDYAFLAPFGVAAMSDAGNQAWLDAVWGQLLKDPSASGGYYADSIRVLAMIAMSGNWWQP
jgi:hypothetical protein